VTRVVKPDELGKPDERLRERMRKLQLTPHEGEETLTAMTLHIPNFCQITLCLFMLHSSQEQEVCISPNTSLCIKIHSLPQ